MKTPMYIQCSSVSVWADLLSYLQSVAVDFEEEHTVFVWLGVQLPEVIEFIPVDIQVTQ